MSDRRSNSPVALPDYDGFDTGSAAGTPDYCPHSGQDGEQQARLIRAIESQIVPRLLISLGAAHRRIARAGVATKPNAEDLAEFARLLASVHQEINPPLLPNSL